MTAPGSSGGYPELGAIAAAYEVPHAGETTIVIEHAGVRVTISLEIDSGAVSGVHLHVHRPGLPEVILRPEDDEDRAGKERGLNVEAQVGDAAFDAAVYLETDAPEAAMRALFAAPEARRAVIDLLRWCRRISLGPEGIDAATSGRGLFDPDAIRPLLDALAVLAALPAVHVDPMQEQERSGITALALAWIAAPFLILLILGVSVAFTPERPSIILAGLGAGIAAWIPIRPWIARHVRGHARSYRYYVMLAALSFLELPAAGYVLAVGLNGILDTSPPMLRRGRVTEARHFESDPDHDARTEFTVAWSDGSTSRHEEHEDRQTFVTGARVVIVRRAGLFGVPWEQKGVEVESDP